MILKMNRSLMSEANNLFDRIQTIDHALANDDHFDIEAPNIELLGYRLSFDKSTLLKLLYTERMTAINKLHGLGIVFEEG